MEYSNAVQILNHHIFDGQKRDLIEKLANNPERYVGVFRPTKPLAKLMQNLLQSHEVHFGDALEYIIKEIINGFGYTNLPLELKAFDGKILSLDQFFYDEKNYFFVEQKIRDDHDSTKKRGQIQNFEAKLSFLHKIYPSNLVGIFYFIDPDLSKNKKFYEMEIEKLKKTYNCDLHLFYGQEFFDYFSQSEIWTDLVVWIEKWKADLKEFPEMDFDLDPRSSFEEIKALEPYCWKKLLESERIWKDGIIRELFSSGTTLKLLFGYFSQQETPEYNEISEILLRRINQYYY